MIKRNQRLFNALNLLTDGVIIVLSYFAAFWLRFDVLGGERSMVMTDYRMISVLLGYAAVIVLVYYVLNLYGYNRLKRRREEGLRILLVNGVGTLGFMAMFYVMRVEHFSRWMLVLFWLISGFGVIIKRTVVRAVLAHYRRLGYNLKHVLVVGSGQLAYQYAQDIAANPQLGLSVLGYVGDTVQSALGERMGGYAQLGEILDLHRPDEVVIALDPQDIHMMPQIMEAADKEGVRLSLIPFFNDYIPRNPTITPLGHTKLIDMRVTPLDNFGWAMVKRLMDILGSLVLILLSSPVMLAVAVGVKLSSPGPILFCQERVGKDKKPFKMYKFRSMRITGTENTGWSTDVDPRKTRFGSFIRKFSLDELPQFFNVLKGDMSLIGPRPEVPFHVSHFKEEIPLYLLRQQVRPGITGWAQVNGLRGDTSIEERVKYDLWYIENWTIWLDFKILLMTAFGGMVNQEKLS